MQDFGCAVTQPSIPEAFYFIKKELGHLPSPIPRNWLRTKIRAIFFDHFSIFDPLFEDWKILVFFKARRLDLVIVEIVKEIAHPRPLRT